jgi:hypothetical protein
MKVYDAITWMRKKILENYKEIYHLNRQSDQKNLGKQKPYKSNIRQAFGPIHLGQC